MRLLSRLLVLLAILTVAAPRLSAQESGEAETADWSGIWQTFWRDGRAVMMLEQDGARVTGTYSPGAGRIEAVADGRLLRGRWLESAAEGAFLFALDGEGRIFSGRFENGEYWNGVRQADMAPAGLPFTRADTPRESLRTIVTAIDSYVSGNSSAALIWEPLIAYAGPEIDQRDRTRRNTAMFQLVFGSQMRLAQAPETGENGRATITLRYSGADYSYDLVMTQDDLGRWRLELPPLEELYAAIESAFRSAGYDSFNDWRESWFDGPRGAVREFLLGTHSWHDGGEELAISRLDLSAIPENLRAFEGQLAAEYLRQVIDRIGYVIWQELPNDGDALSAFTFFRHPLGDIVIAPVESEDGERRWLFTPDSLETLPDLYDAMQALPLAAGVPATAPLTEYFRLHLAAKALSPPLVRRDFLIENWQWIGLAAAALASYLASLVASRALAAGAARLARGSSGEAPARAAAAFGAPARVAVASLLFLILAAQLGLRSDVALWLGAAVALALVFSTAAVLYRLAGAVGEAASASAAAAGPGYVDEVVASLATGLVKIAVVAGALVAAADVLGLPYEGVIAGLGVGGLALAIAARETVANFIAAAILLADRPFKRGDLIETGGTFATVEDVGLRSTKLRTFDDALHVVPNARLAEGPLSNWGRRRSRRCVLAIGVTYDTPRPLLDKFVERLKSVYISQELSTPSVYIGLKGFGESSIDIELWGNFFADDYATYVQAQHKLIADIVTLADDLGVSFAFPTRTVHMAPAESPQPAGVSMIP